MGRSPWTSWNTSWEGDQAGYYFENDLYYGVVAPNVEINTFEFVFKLDENLHAVAAYKGIDAMEKSLILRLKAEDFEPARSAEHLRIHPEPAPRSRKSLAAINSIDDYKPPKSESDASMTSSTTHRKASECEVKLSPSQPTSDGPSPVRASSLADGRGDRFPTPPKCILSAASRTAPMNTEQLQQLKKRMISFKLKQEAAKTKSDESVVAPISSTLPKSYISSSSSNEVQRSPDKRMVCKNDHPLKRDTHASKWWCSNCQRQLEKKTKMWRCRSCDYDICKRCAKKSSRKRKRSSEKRHRKSKEIRKRTKHRRERRDGKRGDRRKRDRQGKKDRESSPKREKREERKRETEHATEAESAESADEEMDKTEDRNENDEDEESTVGEESRRKARKKKEARKREKEDRKGKGARKRNKREERKENKANKEKDCTAHKEKVELKERKERKEPEGKKHKEEKRKTKKVDLVGRSELLKQAREELARKRARDAPEESELDRSSQSAERIFRPRGRGSVHYTRASLDASARSRTRKRRQEPETPDSPSLSRQSEPSCGRRNNIFAQFGQIIRAAGEQSRMPTKHRKSEEKTRRLFAAGGLRR